MARQALNFVDGAMGGVNTMLNVIGTKENIKERRHQRGRELKFDTQRDEDRARAQKWEDTFNAQRDRLNQMAIEAEEYQAGRRPMVDARADEMAELNVDNARFQNSRNPTIAQQDQIALENAQFQQSRQPTIAQQDEIGIQNALFQQSRQPSIAAQDDLNLRNARRQGDVLDINLRTATRQEQQQVLQNSYNMLQAFNSFVDGQDDVDIGPAIESLNYFMGSMINNEPGVQKRISDVVPAPDGSGLIVDLEVTPEGGESYTAPMTQNRSSDPEDQVMVVPFTDLTAIIGEVTQDLQAAGFTGSMPEITERLGEYLRIASGDRSKENAQAQFAQDEAAFGRELVMENFKSQNRRQEGGSGNSTINTIEYFRNNLTNPDGTPITIEQATELANTAKTNPESAVMRVYERLSEANSGVFNRGEKKSEDEVMRDAIAIVESMQEEVLPTRRLTAPRSGGNAAPAPAGAQSNLLDQLPDPAQHQGQIARDTETGDEYQSDGTQWVKIN